MAWYSWSFSPAPCLRPQLLALPALVVADDGVGRVQDVAGGAVVLLQSDGAAAGVLLLEGEDVLDGGPPEAVDGLVVVSHHAEVLIAPRQGGGQAVLQIVGVLILVNEDIAELLLVVAAHLLKAQQQAHGVEDDVVKVQGAGFPQPPLVLHINFGDLGEAVVTGLLALPLVVLGQEHLVLGPGRCTPAPTGGGNCFSSRLKSFRQSLMTRRESSVS
mgnify:CR=1 FL=1